MNYDRISFHSNLASKKVREFALLGFFGCSMSFPSLTASISSTLEEGISFQ